MADDPVSLAALAVDYGWVPIPLDARPGKSGKIPLLKGWQNTKRNEAVHKINRICCIDTHGREKKNKTPLNIGILTGAPSNFVVIDVDTKNNGLEKWFQLLTSKEKETKEQFPTTFTVLTPSGGLHYYFAHDPSTDKFHNGLIRNYSIDFKTTGGQIIMPGSVTEKGTYTVESGYIAQSQPETKIISNNATEEVQMTPIIAKMPPWLVKLVADNQ